MDAHYKERILRIARLFVSDEDPSHDFDHARRVLANAEAIAAEEGGDLEILIPAALFHDVVNFPKDDPRAGQNAEESAKTAFKILVETPKLLPLEKAKRVAAAIRQCSFSKGIVPEELESKILQDADMLESVGAIAVMRTFASSGRMGRRFFHPDDPFCAAREPDPRANAIDLFHARLFKVEARLHTAAAKRLAPRRVKFLHDFLAQLREELSIK